MREREIEAYLVKRVHAIGGEALKFVSPGRVGVPDRMVLLHGFMLFVEVKAPGKKPTPAQKREHTRLGVQGFSVAVVDTFERVDNLITWLQYGPGPVSSSSSVAVYGEPHAAPEQREANPVMKIFGGI